jgi:hypothetical protein
VDRIGVVRNKDAIHGQLCSKSYRAGAGDRRRGFQSGETLGELLGAADQRLPEPLAAGPVERREDLAAIAVEDREPLTARPRLTDPAAERVEGADPTRWQPEAGGQPAGGGDANPQPGEGARPEPGRDQLDCRPAAGRARRRLDLAQQRGRVAWPAVGREAELRGVQKLAVAPGADRGIGGRGVEADDDQGFFSAPLGRASVSPGRRSSRLFCL